MPKPRLPNKEVVLEQFRELYRGLMEQAGIKPKKGVRFDPLLPSERSQLNAFAKTMRNFDRRRLHPMGRSFDETNLSFKGKIRKTVDLLLRSAKTKINVLDLGCGDGELLLAIKGRDPKRIHVTGVSMSLPRYAKRMDKIRIGIYPRMKLDQKYDLIIDSGGPSVYRPFQVFRLDKTFQAMIEDLNVGGVALTVAASTLGDAKEWIRNGMPVLKQAKEKGTISFSTFTNRGEKYFVIKKLTES